MIIGIVGGGQLAQMLGLAGKPMGHSFRILDPSLVAPARTVGTLVEGAYDDRDALMQLAEGCDVVTFDFENVPASSVQFLSTKVPVFPGADILAIAQDRFEEKTTFESLGIPTPAFALVDSLDDVQFALQDLHVPAVLKTRRQGYDGKGQAVLRSAEDIVSAWEKIGDVPLLVEKFIPFDREVSLLSVRGRTGEIAFYPLIENVHREGILRVSRAPAHATDVLQHTAQQYARSILEKFSYVGVLAIEFCQVGDQLMAIEMAPRVHNSGHLTIEAAATSQFENHLRAISGMPLGPTEIAKPSAMVNLIGTIPSEKSLAAIPGASVHVYGKEPRPGRKLGHVTVVRETWEEVEESIKHSESLL